MGRGHYICLQVWAEFRDLHKAAKTAIKSRKAAGLNATPVVVEEGGADEDPSAGEKRRRLHRRVDFIAAQQFDPVDPGTYR